MYKGALRRVTHGDVLEKHTAAAEWITNGNVRAFVRSDS
jgi:hypothetical protein